MKNVFAYTFDVSPRLQCLDVTANYSGRGFVSVIALIHLRTLMDTSDYHHQQHLVLHSLAFKAVMMSLSYEHNLPDSYRAYTRATR
jgi:hypothetical protein